MLKSNTSVLEFTKEEFRELITTIEEVINGVEGKAGIVFGDPRSGQTIELNLVADNSEEKAYLSEVSSLEENLTEAELNIVLMVSKMSGKDYLFLLKDYAQRKAESKPQVEESFGFGDEDGDDR